MTEPSRAGTRTLTRALDILDCFQVNRPALTLGDLVELTGLPKATAFRLARTLEVRGYLVRDETGVGFRLGHRLIHLGSMALGSTEIRQVALPIMRDLGKKSGETVTLFVRQGVWKVCIEKVESPREVRTTLAVGRVAPITVGASGKVLLAWLDRASLADLLKTAGLPRLTEYTITDRGALMEEIDKVRKQGYAISVEERELGSASVGAPVRDHTGKTVASLNCSGSSEDFSPDKIEELVPLTVAAADAVSLGLGYVTSR
ncbi:MAG: IclR family transcriptional regulator [Ignavibacteriales bacterium]